MSWKSNLASQDFNNLNYNALVKEQEAFSTEYHVNEQ